MGHRAALLLAAVLLLLAGTASAQRTHTRFCKFPLTNDARVNQSLEHLDDLLAPRCVPGHVIRSAGVELPQRPFLHLPAGCADDPGERETDCTAMAGGGGGGGGAPTTATYLTNTPDATLSNEIALSTLSSGLLLTQGGTGLGVYAGSTCPPNLVASGTTAVGGLLCTLDPITNLGVDAVGILQPPNLFDATTAGQCLLSGGAGGDPMYDVCPGGGGAANAYASITGNAGTATAGLAAPLTLAGTAPLTIACAEGSPDQCTVSHTAQNPNAAFLGPAVGGPGTPGFRAIQASDVPFAVNGPAGANDNGCVRFDGPTGKLIQDTAGLCTLDDSGNLIAVSATFLGEPGATTLTVLGNSGSDADVAGMDVFFTQADDADGTDTNAGHRVTVASDSNDPGDLVAGYVANLNTFSGDPTEIAYRITGPWDWLFDTHVPWRSTMPTGTPPFQVASQTRIPNLNADMVDGLHASDMVEGPETATDNAIVRFDGPTGSLIQNSVCLLSDTGTETCPADPTLGGLMQIREGQDDGTDSFGFHIPDVGGCAASHQVELRPTDCRMPLSALAGTPGLCLQTNATTGIVETAAGPCGGGGGGAASVTFLTPFGTADEATVLYPTAETCIFTRFAIPYSATPGLPSMIYDVAQTASGATGGAAVYTADGSARLFLTTLAVGSGTGNKFAHTTAALASLSPGEYWLGVSTGVTAGFALRAANAQPTGGPQFSASCGGGTLPATISPPAQPVGLGYHPPSVQFTVGPSTTSTTSTSTTSTVAATSTTTSSSTSSTSTSSTSTSSSSSSSSTSTSSTTTSTAGSGFAAAPNWCDGANTIACWNLDQATDSTRVATGGTCDTAGSDCDLTESVGDNVALNQTAGQFTQGAGSAEFDLDGDDGEFLTCANATCNELNRAGEQSVTWGCWARSTTNTCTAGTDEAYILNGENYVVGRGCDNAFVPNSAWCLINDDNAAGNPVYAEGATNGFAINTARDLVCVFSNTANTLQLYRDGQTDGASAAVGAIEPESADFYISSSTTGSSAEWYGQIDMCFVSSVAWTATDVCHEYACEIDGSLCMCDGGTPANYLACDDHNDCRQGGNTTALCSDTSGSGLGGTCSGRIGTSSSASCNTTAEAGACNRAAP